MGVFQRQVRRRQEKLGDLKRVYYEPGPVRVIDESGGHGATYLKRVGVPYAKFGPKLHRHIAHGKIVRWQKS